MQKYRFVPVIALMLLFLMGGKSFGDLYQGLITYLPFNGSINATSGINGRLPSGSVQKYADDAPPILGTQQSYIFDGTNGGVVIDNAPDPCEYTLAAWVKLDSVGTSNRNIVTRGGNDTAGGSWSDCIRINPSGKAENYLWDTAARWITAPTVFGTGVWHHIAGTAKLGGSMQLYVDGVLVASWGGPVGTLWPFGNRWVIGGISDGSFIGKVAGLGIWNRELSAESIYSLATKADPFVRYCGDQDTQYSMYDINQDCYVDLQDFAQMASAWLTSTDPLTASSNLKSIQYIVVNFTRPNIDEVRAAFPLVEGATVQVGVGAIYTPLSDPESTVLAQLDSDLAAAEAANMPIVIQSDTDCWTGSGSLWNWWDPSQPGYDPNNKNNVEWYGWTSDSALKISWRNWGQQIRVSPAPNLMAPVFRNALHRSYDVIVPKVVSWWQDLPHNKKNLFVGFKVGWESGIGINAWYYPNGNYYKETYPNDPSHDPTSGINAHSPPAYGAQQIGYAALVSEGIKTSGTITETDLARITGKHLTDLSQRAMSLGLPREKIFTHTQTWAAPGLFSLATVNLYSCPGCSFYSSNTGGSRAAFSDFDLAINQSGAPHWATPECFFTGSQTTANWKAFLKNTLDTRCKYLNIYNWNSIKNNPAILDAIRQVVNESVK